MDAWLLGTRLALVLFVAVRWLETGSQSGAAAVLLILAYVCLAALCHIVKRPVWNRLLITSSLGLSAASALVFDSLFVYFVPLAGAELLFAFTRDLRFTPVPALIPLVFLPLTHWSEYLLCAAFSLFVFVMAVRARTRLESLISDNESLRVSNEAQRRRVLAGAEYENQVRRLTQLEERNRLAREVHDRVGHAIAGSVVQLEAASALLTSDPDRAGQMIRRSVGVLREGMESIRTTLRGIKPEPEELGIQRLKALLDRFQANNSIHSRLSYTGDIGIITPARWAVILDNTREALTNVVKHSSAANVSVGIEIMAKLVKVEIRDDGRGAYTITKGIGIRGIEERTQEEGGTVIVDGTKGFSAIMLFPRVEDADGD